jgi:DNA-binding NtrC family response regulator
LWLETVAENTHFAIAILLSDLGRAFAHGRKALETAEQSGVAVMRRACLGNLANLLFSSGEYEKAIHYFGVAGNALPSPGDNYNASLDGVARIHLSQNRLEDCAALLDRIDETLRSGRDRALYAHRYATLTRTQLLARQGRLDDALASADLLLRLSDESGDHLLSRIALLTKTELLQDAGRTSDAMAILDSVTDRLAQLPPELYAHYERILASGLVAQGDLPAATTHIARARRLYEGLRSAPALLDLARRWDEVTKRPVARSAALPPETTTDRPDAAARNVLQTVAALLRHHGRPELVARELVYLLGETGSVVSAQAVSTSDDEGDTPQVLASVTAADAVDAVERRMPVGVARDRALSLVLRVRPDADSIATATAARLLLTTVQDLERARADREERLSLWPADDEPTEPGQAVSVGQMHGLMESARRIASSPVSVFITGESGTGKEVLARAIHRFSDKADKPFIAFNCTAVPREMLESQLFGYRKGSFTGADRDHPGIIGAARGGTLFLDEIGELGLDLQPKLLRFLESNEICPIGESVPFTVNVRVIAATNANVEQLVSAGRFREDLFYRLNVFRLRVDPLRERREEIPPLVRYFLTLAVAEFKKGDVRVAEDTMEHLLLCRWPGNVRQLQNEIRRMVALAEPHSVLTPNDLSPEVFNARLAPRAHAGPFELTVPLRGKLAPTLAIVEREMLKRALKDHHGKVDDAARALGLSRKGLYLKRQRLGL